MLQKNHVILEATVYARMDACVKMTQGMRKNDAVLFEHGRKLHTDMERIARRYRSSS